MILELFLPFPPSVNNYYVQTRNGRFISKKGKEFRAATAESIVEQLGDFEPLEQKILMEVVLYMPDKRKRDVDNYVKALLDAMSHADVWVDDVQVDQLFIYRGNGNKDSGVWVCLSEAGPVFPMGHTPQV